MVNPDCAGYHASEAEEKLEEEFVTISCRHGGPLILIDGEWSQPSEKISFHEWIEYALWMQRDVLDKPLNIRLRSDPLKSYSVQVPASQLDLVMYYVQTPFEQMQAAYRKRYGRPVPSLRAKKGEPLFSQRVLRRHLGSRGGQAH